MQDQTLELPDVSKYRWGTKQDAGKIGPKSLEHIMILIVVNSTEELGILFDYLKGFGFRVLVANDGESALAVLEHIKPDIILLDTKLPGLDGFEVCRRLKNNDNTKHIPIIFITGQTNTVAKVRGFTLGAVDYITRPIQTEEVLVRLKTHLTIQNLQMALEEQNASLQEGIIEREKLIEELDAFSHTVAHDLKNPLAAVVNYAQFLLKFGDKLSLEDMQKQADTIFRNGRRMVNIIDELLLLSSVRKEEVEVEPLEMGPIVAEALDRLALIIKEYEAKIVVPAESDWPVVWGYGPWVEAVWTNYISNAIKYGGRPPLVELGCTVHIDDVIQFWVKDNGDGLAAEAQARLFTPFTRVSQVSTEGHGLGLSIVQRIIEKLGGQVEVKSEGVPGEGCIFSFYLPGLLSETDPGQMDG